MKMNTKFGKRYKEPETTVSFCLSTNVMDGSSAKGERTFVFNDRATDTALRLTMSADEFERFVIMLVSSKERNKEETK